mgnify:CR=1 FL=1
MKIKMLISCSGNDFSYHQGQTVETTSEIAKDLIEAGYAEEIKAAATKTGAKNAESD